VELRPDEVADGIDGPIYVYSDGSVEHVPVEPPPPALKGDVTFELTQGGFEIWFSGRISSHHPGGGVVYE
jgi:hypothetical protein